MEEIVAPLFAVEDDDLTAFPSVAEAERYLEPPDVIAGEYQFFDSVGHVLTAEVVDNPPNHGLLPLRRRGHTSVRLAFTALDRRPDMLRAALIRYIQAVGPSRLGLTGEVLRDLSLSEMSKQVAMYVMARP